MARDRGYYLRRGGKEVWVSPRFHVEPISGNLIFSHTESNAQPRFGDTTHYPPAQDDEDVCVYCRQGRCVQRVFSSPAYAGRTIFHLHISSLN